MKKFNIYDSVKISVNILTFAIAAMLAVLAIILVTYALFL